MACEDVEGNWEPRLILAPGFTPEQIDQVTAMLNEQLGLKRAAAKERLLALWEQHDRLERDIIRLERLFSDAELDALLERE
jgi:hypothetical protein